jgi:hypothetical protein
MKVGTTFKMTVRGTVTTDATGLVLGYGSTTGGAGSILTLGSVAAGVTFMATLWVTITTAGVAAPVVAGEAKLSTGVTVNYAGGPLSVNAADLTTSWYTFYPTVNAMTTGAVSTEFVHIEVIN